MSGESTQETEATALGGAETPTTPTTPAATEAAPVETKPTETKPVEAAKPVTAAPVDFDPKLPEGFKADDAALGEFKALVKAEGIKGEAAQKVIDLYAKLQTTASKQADDALTATQKEWADKLKADKEFGGAKWDASLQMARKAMVKFGSPALREYLEHTGLGNHPELFRFVLSIGRAMSEDTVSGAAGKGASDNSEEALHRKLFPKMFEAPNT